MILNDKVKSILPINNLDKCYVVTDFDRTITNGSSKTSWSILSQGDLISDEYNNERQMLFDKYRPIEIDETMDFNERSILIREWYVKHIELFIKYKVSEKTFEEASNNLRIMEFRNGAKEFIKFLYENNVPLIIISAGIGNFIEQFLINNDCLYDNIYISSNKVIFKDGIAYGLDSNIIHSLNKNEVSLPNSIKQKLVNRDQVLLLGDQISDLKMISDRKTKSIIDIGFYTKFGYDSINDLTSSFDIVCDEEDDYKVLSKVLFKQS